MKGHILILTANILFGISVPVFKHLLNIGMQPEVIAFLRAVVTCTLFWLLSLFLHRERVTWRDLGLLAVCGICGVGINQLLFVVGLKMASPVDGSIIASARRCDDSRQLHGLCPLPRVVAVIGATLFGDNGYEVDVPRGDSGIVPIFSRETG